MLRNSFLLIQEITLKSAGYKIIEINENKTYCFHVGEARRVHRNWQSYCYIIFASFSNANELYP